MKVRIAPCPEAEQHEQEGESCWAKQSLEERLIFVLNVKNYELWKAKFLVYLCLQGLKDQILKEPSLHDDDDEGKNDKAYELSSFRCSKIRSLVTNDAADDGRAALKIL